MGSKLAKIEFELDDAIAEKFGELVAPLGFTASSYLAAMVQWSVVTFGSDPEGVRTWLEGASESSPELSQRLINFLRNRYAS